MTARAGRFRWTFALKSVANKVVAELEALGLLVKVEDHRLAVSTCYRCSPPPSNPWNPANGF
jgi:valyl-tRNA synthetase